MDRSLLCVLCARFLKDSRGVGVGADWVRGACWTLTELLRHPGALGAAGPVEVGLVLDHLIRKKVSLKRFLILA